MFVLGWTKNISLTEIKFMSACDHDNSGLYGCNTNNPPELIILN